MKKILLFTAAAFLLFNASSNALQQKVIRVKPGFATVIVCPGAPELVSVGNSQAFTVQTTGNYVLVKPTVSRGSTNMFIKVGMESYNIVLQVSETADLEVRLLPTTPPSAVVEKNGKSAAPLMANKNGEVVDTKMKDLAEISPKTRSILASYLKTRRPYTHSVKNSDVIFALDHMVQIEDKLYMLCTVINDSKIPYDIGYARFKLIDYASSFLFSKKKIKETELEPIREFYDSPIKPNTTSRLMFVFEKQGFSDKSTLEIKCHEENGRRDLVLNVPGDYVE
jgi:hypothetical protein